MFMGKDRVRLDEGTIRRETALLYCLAGLPLCHCADMLDTGVWIGTVEGVCGANKDDRERRYDWVPSG